MINHPRRSRAALKSRVAAASTVKRNHDYAPLLAGIRASFKIRSRDAAALFLTDAADLNEIYLGALPRHRQLHDCSCCRRFLEAYGGLVTISEDGETVPVMWNPAGIDEFYHPAFVALQARVKKARVTSVFLTKQTEWGNAATGTWTHMFANPPAALVYRERVLTAGQAMAASKENFRTVATALSEFKPPVLDEALRILQADALARSEKFIGPVKWLRALHDRPKGRRGENVLWLAVATAPEGYCHPKASVLAPLLDDIVAGLPFADLKARFDAKMHPLQYQRPQAAPKAGNIRAAEELVAKLGIERSLERRFARLEELQLQATWLPAAPHERAKSGGIFGHIKPKNGPDAVMPVDMPAATMTWEKFARTILPNAERLEISVPTHGRFIALTTAVHADAPPVLKWDLDDERNPVAWYCYNAGSHASQWGLTAGTWASVEAITPFPNLWGTRPMPFLSDGVILVIEGAADTQTGQGNALFPECLREEIHGARAVIEAYSRSATLADRERASACGYDVRKGAADCVLRAFSAGAWGAYRIDRWD